jgi:hypothetical protein
VACKAGHIGNVGNVGNVARDGVGVCVTDVGTSVPMLPTGGQGEVLLSTPVSKLLDKIVSYLT